MRSPLLTSAIHSAAAAAHTSTPPTPTTTGGTPTTTTAKPSGTGFPEEGKPSPAPVDGGCPFINNSRQYPLDPEGNAIPIPPQRSKAQAFLRLCNTNYPSGAKLGNPNAVELLSFWTRNLDECIVACGMYNLAAEARGDSPTGRTLCRAVGLEKVPGGRCSLKNATGTTMDTFGRPGDFVTAVLIKDEGIDGLVAGEADL